MAPAQPRHRGEVEPQLLSQSLYRPSKSDAGCGQARARWAVNISANKMWIRDTSRDNSLLLVLDL